MRRYAECLLGFFFLCCRSICQQRTNKFNAFACFSLPFGLDISAGADVVLGGQHKLVIENPLGLVVQYGGRVQLDHLVVLHREIVSGALQVSNLITPEMQINE